MSESYWETLPVIEIAQADFLSKIFSGSIARRSISGEIIFDHRGDMIQGFKSVESGYLLDTGNKSFSRIRVV
jgi:hypothetical protein